MRRTPPFPLLLAATSLSAVLALSAGASADSVGTAGAVNTSTSGTPPGGATRVIEIGTQVVANEKIQTTATGSVQVLFIDKTTLNVGPNSTLVIDRFVFNPATTRGELALSLSKGVVRVVGGIATHSEGATIRTPVAAIGLRGGIAIISHSSAKGTQATLGFGHLSITSLCAAANCAPTTTELTRPGFSVNVAAFSRVPSYPGRVSSQQLAQSNAQLTSQKGQTGGATQQPTDSLARTYNVGTPTSAGAPIVQTASAGRANALTAANAMGQTVAQGSQNSASVRTTQTVVVQDLIKSLTPPPPSGGGGGGGGGTPVTPIKPPPPPPPPLTYAMVTSGPFSTSAGGSPVPYLTGAFAGNGGFKVSPILGYQSGGLNADGSQNTTSRQFQAGLSVTGKGTAQNATLFVMTSQISNAPNNTGFTQAGGFTGVTVRNAGPAAPWFGLAGGSVSSATPTSSSNTVSTTNGTPIAGFTLNNTNTNLSNGFVTNSTSSNFVRPGGTTSYTFNSISTGTPTFSAGAHPNLSLHGYVGGVMVTASGGPPGAATNFTKPYVVTNLTGTPGDVGIFLPGDSSEMLANFNVGSVAAPTGGLSSSSYRFGSLNANNANGFNGARGTYVSPSNFAARDAEATVNGVTSPLSQRDGMTVGFANQQLVTAQSVGANTAAFLTSISTSGTTVRPCACDSTQWGFWSAFNGSNNSDGQLAFQDQGPLLLWVAGVSTPTSLANQLPMGSATYTGHAIANIANPNNITSYLAAGTFSNTVNFGARTGAVTINGLDSANYAGTVKIVPSTVTFNGTLATAPGSAVGGRTAALNGSFFQGGPAANIPFGEMGGSLILNGTNGYLGSGIFAARKP